VTKNPSIPRGYTKKFIAIVWATFLALVRPVSTMAKPACINMTRNPASRVHIIFIATLLWPTASATSCAVGAPGVTEGISKALPVLTPLGSGSRSAEQTNETASRAKIRHKPILLNVLRNMFDHPSEISLLLPYFQRHIYN
jgi:hypothetical protein